MSFTGRLQGAGGNQLFFVVEEGQFNQGDFGQALRMIDLTAETGADAIEFQIAVADEFYVRTHQWHSIYKKREFTDRQMEELESRTRANGLDLIVTPLSESIVHRMAAIGCSGFNINASDINNPSMLRAVANSGLPFCLSIALATGKEVKWAVELIRAQSPAAEFFMLHGQHTMASGENGVDPEDTSLGYLSTLQREFGRPVGFVDHTPLEWFPSCAVAAGATIVTKHMAPDHDMRGPDWQICLDPAQMKCAVEMARKVFRSMKAKEKVLAPGEHMDRAVMRRSIVANRDMDAGHVIQSGDIAFKRPGSGMAPDAEQTVLGAVLLQAVKKDEAITPELLKD